MTSSRTEALELQSLEMDLPDDLEIDLEELPHLEIEVNSEDLGFLEFLRLFQDLALDTKVSDDNV